MGILMIIHNANSVTISVELAKKVQLLVRLVLINLIEISITLVIV